MSSSATGEILRVDLRLTTVNKTTASSSASKSWRDGRVTADPPAIPPMPHRLTRADLSLQDANRCLAGILVRTVSARRPARSRCSFGMMFSCPPKTGWTKPVLDGGGCRDRQLPGGRGQSRMISSISASSSAVAGDRRSAHPGVRSAVCQVDVRRRRRESGIQRRSSSRCSALRWAKVCSPSSVSCTRTMRGHRPDGRAH